MTIRKLIEGKKRWIMTIALLGFAAGVVGVILARLNVLNVEPLWAMLPGVAVFLIALLYAHHFAFPCPRCNGRLEALVMNMGGLFALDPRIRHCPFCGGDIDGEVDADQDRGGE